MSGRRCKILRAEFARQFGRPVRRSVVNQTFGEVLFNKCPTTVLKSVETHLSEWRRLKKAYLRQAAA